MCLVTLKFGRAWAFAKTNVDESISTFRYGIFQEHTFCFSDTLGVSGGRHRAADLEFETLFEDRLDHNLAWATECTRNLALAAREWNLLT